MKKSIKDKTYCMPFLAMCLNLSWEFVFAFIYKSDVFQDSVLNMVCS
ncbi:transmembrane-type terpene cyclase [Faecalimicrobium sp. JNUCC 81]